MNTTRFHASIQAPSAGPQPTWSAPSSSLRRIGLAILALTALLGSVGSVGVAQASPNVGSHGASVLIPTGSFFSRIRFVNDSRWWQDVRAPDPVEFTFSSVTFRPGTYGPTNGPFNWDDIQVLHLRNSPWEVVVTTVGSASFDWSKISITPTAADPYDLGATTSIARGPRWTWGWQSLGIDPEDYTIALDGTEDPGSYFVTVIFTLQTP